MKNVVAIVQARMGAKRLPNKMMLDLHGYPVIEWVSRRLARSEKINKIVFALPDSASDDVLDNYLLDSGANVFRGSEKDVLQRYCQAAKMYNADYIVRICADNPFVSAEEIDKLIVYFDAAKCDYAYNHIPRENLYPDGLGAEITTIGILEYLDEHAVLMEHREHIFNYIWDNQNDFSIATMNPADSAIAHPELKLDLDTEHDYTMLLQLHVNPDMSARQIVKAAMKAWN